MLDGEGRLQLDAFVPDTLLRRDYRRLYEALDYVADHDTLAFARFGVELGKVREAVPDVFRDYVVYGYDYRTDDNCVGVPGRCATHRPCPRVSGAVCQPFVQSL